MTKRLMLRSISSIWLLSFSSLSLAQSNDYEHALQTFNEGKYQDSYIHLKNALQQNPESLPAKILMGKILLHKGYYQEAVLEFEEALAFNADMNLVLADYLSALMFLKQYQQVITLADGYKLNRANQFEWALQVATAHRNLNNIEQARGFYQKAIELDNTSTRSLNSLASLELSQKNYQQAIEIAQKSLEIEPKNSRTLHLIGRIHQSNGQVELAIMQYNLAIEIAPKDPIIKRSLISAYIKSEQFERAKKLITLVQTETPDDAHIMLLNSWMLSRDKNEQEAVAVLEALSEKLSLANDQDLINQPSLLFVSGMSAYMQGNYEKAHQDLFQYLELVPNDLQAVGVLSSVHLKQNNSRKALKLLESQQDRIFNSLSLALQLSDLYEQNNKRFKAQPLLEKILSVYPDNVQASIKLANLLDQSGRRLQAQHLLSDLAKVHPKEGLIYLTKGLLHLNNGEYKQALEISQLLLKSAPDQVDFLNLNIAALIKLNLIDEAKISAAKLLTIQPQHFAGRFNQATIFKKQFNFEQAKTILITLVEEKPDYEQAQLSLAQVEIALGNSNNAINILSKIKSFSLIRTKDELLFDLYFKQGNYLEAHQVIKALDKRYPLDASLVYRKAQVLVALNNTNDAVRQLKVLFSLAQGSARMLYQTGMLQRQVKDFDSAEKSLTESIKLNDKQLVTHIELARVFLDSGQSSKATSKADKLLNEFPQNANVTLLKGDIAYHSNELIKSVEWYWQSFKIDNQFNLVLVKLYQLAKDGYSPDKFTKQLSNLINKEPDVLWRKKLLADHLLNHQKYQQALGLYLELEANAEFKNDPYLYNNMANIYLIDNPEKAQEAIAKAHKLAPNSASILDTYGWVQYKLNSFDTALDYLRKAYSIDSTNKTIRYHIASTLYKLSRISEAKRELQYALEGSETQPWYNEAQSLLANL